MNVVPHSLSSPDLAPCNFLKDCHFDAIETELQAMLNPLTEHNFQDAFEKMAQALTVHTCKMALLQG
jgi:hypothetical protein